MASKVVRKRGDVRLGEVFGMMIETWAPVEEGVVVVVVC